MVCAGFWEQTCTLKAQNVLPQLSGADIGLLAEVLLALPVDSLVLHCSHMMLAPAHIALRGWQWNKYVDVSQIVTIYCVHHKQAFLVIVVPG
jgi:hypothetical protein